jgi:hypothetical protein
MFSDVHNRIHFTLSFPKDTTNHDDTSNTYIQVSNPRVRRNPNKASEYVQVLEKDPNNTLNEINNILKARCHYQSFPSKTLSKKTWTKCLLSLSKFFDHLCQRIGGKSCKHEKMASTLTNYENIAVTLCLMSIAILRRLRDRARVRRRATRSWLLRRKQRSAYNTLLKELHTEDLNEFRNYFRMDKTNIQSILL